MIRNLYKHSSYPNTLFRYSNGVSVSNARRATVYCGRQLPVTVCYSNSKELLCMAAFDVEAPKRNIQEQRKCRVYISAFRTTHTGVDCKRSELPIIKFDWFLSTGIRFIINRQGHAQCRQQRSPSQCQRARWVTPPTNCMPNTKRQGTQPGTNL